MARDEEPLELRARAAALEMGVLIREALPRFKAELTPDSLPKLLAAAALARQLCLLEALVAVCDAGQARVAGLIMRAQWETHLVGLYCILADKDAVKALIADRAAWAPGIERIWKLEGAWHEKTEMMARWYGEVEARRLNFADVAEKVQTLLREKGYTADITTAHQRLYKGESTFTAHPGFEALLRQLKTDGNECMPDVSFEPIPGRAAYLCNCAWSVTSLAEPLFDTFPDLLDRLATATAKLRAISDV